METSVLERSTDLIGEAGMRLRRCSCCGKILPITDFAKNADCVGGYEPTCKSCRSLRRKERAAQRKAAMAHADITFDLKSLPDDVLAQELIRRGWKGEITKTLTIAI